MQSVRVRGTVKILTGVAPRATTIGTLWLAAAALCLTGCATKRYPIATPLAPAEAALLTCKDIALELVRADQVEKQINDTGSMDIRSIAGFLGDFGIGNGMAKSEARKALATRRAALRDTELQKGCMKDIVPPTTQSLPTTRVPTRAALAWRQAEALGAWWRREG